MAKKIKGPSMSRVAKTYKKKTKPSSSVEDAGSGKAITESSGRIPTQTGLRTPTKLKVKDITLGGTKDGKGVTKKRLGRA